MGLAEFFVRIANVYSGQELNPGNYTGNSKCQCSTNNNEGVENTKLNHPNLKTVPQDRVELNSIPDDDDTQQTDKADTGKSEDTKDYSTYYFNRQAKLDYNLQLQFNLSALTQTIQQLSEGDVLSVEL